MVNNAISSIGGAGSFGSVGFLLLFALKIVLVSLALEKPVPMIGVVDFQTCLHAPLMNMSVPSAGAAFSQQIFAMNPYFFARFFILPSPSPDLTIPGSWPIIISVWISLAYRIASSRFCMFVNPVPACIFRLVILQPVVAFRTIMLSPRRLLWFSWFRC